MAKSYEGSPADEREDARGQARFNKMKAPPMRKKKKAPPMRKMPSPVGLATPPGGGDEGFGGGGDMDEMG